VGKNLQSHQLVHKVMLQQKQAIIGILRYFVTENKKYGPELDELFS
jgi:hypothetical protein